MTSDKTNASQRTFEFLEDDAAVQDIPRDDSSRADIEKSALGDDANNLIEEIVDEVNMEMAWARVKANRGAPGPDGITVEDFRKLMSLGLSYEDARPFALSDKGPWRLSKTSGVQRALSNDYLRSEGILSLEERWCQLASSRRTAECGPACSVV